MNWYIFAGIRSIPSWSAREFMRFLTDQGFIHKRTNGDHMIFGHPDGRTCSVPNHRNMDKATVLRIVKRDMGMSLPEFQSIVR